MNYKIMTELSKNAQVPQCDKTTVMRGFKTELKRLIKLEFKNNKNKYHDIEEITIGIENNKITFFDGDLVKTNQI